MRVTAVIIGVALSLPSALLAQDMPALQKRVAELEQKLKDAELEKLKLRLNLAEEKLLNSRTEFNMLIVERSKLCNELQATDRATFESRCTEKGTK